MLGYKKILILLYRWQSLEVLLKAAEKLGCSQSTVSFQIIQLENSLDIRLFERINHTVKNNRAGQAGFGVMPTA